MSGCIWVIVFVLIEIIEDHGASHIWCVSARTLVFLLGVAIVRLLCRCWGFTLYVCDGFQVGVPMHSTLCFVGGGTVIFCQVIQHATCADVMHMYNAGRLVNC